MKKIEDILEFNKVVFEIKKYCVTIGGNNYFDNLSPFLDIANVKQEYNKLNEFKDVINRYGFFSIFSKLILEDEIKNIKKGIYLNCEKLLLLKEELFSSKEINDFIKRRDIKFNYLKSDITKISFNEHLYNLINSSIDQNGNIYDDATLNLKQIRKKLRLKRKELKDITNKCMEKYSNILLGDSISFKNGHPTLQINTSFKSNINGIIHDISDSGMTTFIEPIEILDCENEINVYEIKEKDEINKILYDISTEILNSSNFLILNNKIFTYLDTLQAKIKFLNEFNGSIPLINNFHNIELYGVRHPLIDKKKCVKNDFILGQKERMMIISGPNAGGKTVALKTIGLSAYMAKCALPLLCDEKSSIGYFDNIFLDIGDNQSIENNLSTFSSHIKDLSGIIQLISSKDLVLIDEIGSGTDPKEGASLSISICNYLLNSNCLSFITSHFDELKKYAFNNGKISNSSFLFDEKNITPTYKLLNGVSGKSYGFIIAKKYGLNNSVIENAKEIYNGLFMTANDLKLEELEKRERNIIKKEEYIKTQFTILKKEQEKNIEKEKNLKEKEEKLKQRKLEKFDEYIDKMYDNVNDIYDEFLNTKDIKKAEEKLNKLSKNKDNKEVKIGDNVTVLGLDQTGKVLDIKDNKVKISTNDGFTINTTKDKVQFVSNSVEKSKTIQNIDNQIFGRKQESLSLNLIGFHTNEAIEILEKYLDNCLLSGNKKVKIIHGYGSGRLKQAIHSYLKTSIYVKKYYFGDEFDGGNATTIVELK